MIRKLSHAPVYVLDQDRAKDFYVGKLGFEVRTDATMGAFRWLTVGPKSQPDVEADLRVSIGLAYLSNTLYEKAEVQFRRALELRRSFFGAEHVKVA